MNATEIDLICRVIEKSVNSSMVSACCLDNETDRGLVAEHIIDQVRLAVERQEKRQEARHVLVQHQRDAGDRRDWDAANEAEAALTAYDEAHCKCGREFKPETFYCINGVRKCYTCFKDHNDAKRASEHSEAQRWIDSLLAKAGAS